MKTMADATFRAKLTQFRRQYARLSGKPDRTEFLNSLQRTYGADRKYLIKLLSGKRSYKEPHGRGKSYKKPVEDLVVFLRRKCGYPCSPYFHAMLPKVISDYEKAGGQTLDPETCRLAMAMSPATLGRIFKRHPAPGPRRATATSGANGLKKQIPACPGKSIEDGSPGVFQLDTVAHGGGGVEPFFYSLVMTDAQTQWCELSFAWCRSAAATLGAYKKMAGRLPFPVRRLHPDNGSEMLNKLFVSHVMGQGSKVEMYRSRPYQKNDNCRVEQKNGSILRVYFKEYRLDNQSMQEELDAIAERLALYVNLFLPTKKLTKIVRDNEGRIMKEHRSYDSPATPLQRLELCDPNNGNLKKLKELYSETNSIELYREIKSRIAAVVRKIERFGTHGKSATSQGTPAFHAGPSGSSPAMVADFPCRHPSRCPSR